MKRAEVNGIASLLPVALVLWIWDLLKITYYFTCDLYHVVSHFWSKFKHHGGMYTQAAPITQANQLVHDPTRKTVIIVGGSFAGVSAATQLATDPRFQVILIEPKDFFEYTPGILRAMVAPHHHPEIVAPLRFDNVQVIQGWAGDITPTTVTIRPTPPPPAGSLSPSQRDRSQQSVTVTTSNETADSGNSLEPFTLRYDYLVLAHGTSYATPIKAIKSPELHRAVRSSQMRMVALELANKRAATIVGAGLVGVELAAEIAIVMPQVQVTLHSATPTILPGMHPRVIEYCHQFLVKNGVTIQVNSNFDLANYQPTKDEAYYPCVGVVPSVLTMHHSLMDQIALNESKMQTVSSPSCPFKAANTRAVSSSTSSMPNDATQPDSTTQPLVVDPPPPSTLSYEELKQRGSEIGVMLPNARIRAQPSQLIKGLPNVFAVGDCALYTANMPQMAFTSEAEGHAVARSIANLESGKPPVDFPQGHFHCDVPPALCCISLGPYDGVVIFNDILLFGRLAAYGKDFIEVSKVASVRQNVIAQLIWAVGDPAAFAMSAAYNATLNRFSSTRTIEWLAAGTCVLGGAAWGLGRFLTNKALKA